MDKTFTSRSNWSLTGTVERIRFSFVCVHQRIRRDELRQCVNVFGVLPVCKRQTKSVSLVWKNEQTTKCYSTKHDTAHCSLGLTSRAAPDHWWLPFSVRSSVWNRQLLEQEPGEQRIQAAEGERSAQGGWCWEEPRRDGWKTNLLRLIVSDSLSENVDCAVNVLLMGVHGHQSRHLRIHDNL